MQLRDLEAASEEAWSWGRRPTPASPEGQRVRRCMSPETSGSSHYVREIKVTESRMIYITKGNLHGVLGSACATDEKAKAQSYDNLPGLGKEKTPHYKATYHLPLPYIKFSACESRGLCNTHWGICMIMPHPMAA
ncbi:uncharacterized protein LOC117064178 [Trachypithecus francoisi]|uniref:uncharacterized protein LOC117064178 n=1 Tax=Trachypithecus francoisi TaxID=54180 RepID=UPI00141B0868|nr:uncharacterized protein LOC117064178 [Trachypithecus francoisi]